jgi:hypothetical protein
MRYILNSPLLYRLQSTFFASRGSKPIQYYAFTCNTGGRQCSGWWEDIQCTVACSINAGSCWHIFNTTDPLWKLVKCYCSLHLFIQLLLLVSSPLHHPLSSLMDTRGKTTFHHLLLSAGQLWWEPHSERMQIIWKIKTNSFTWKQLHFSLWHVPFMNYFI